MYGLEHIADGVRVDRVVLRGDPLGGATPVAVRPPVFVERQPVEVRTDQPVRVHDGPAERSSVGGGEETLLPTLVPVRAAERPLRRVRRISLEPSAKVEPLAGGGLGQNGPQFEIVGVPVEGDFVSFGPCLGALKLVLDNGNRFCFRDHALHPTACVEQLKFIAVLNTCLLERVIAVERVVIFLQSG